MQGGLNLCKFKSPLLDSVSSYLCGEIVQKITYCDQNRISMRLM